MTCEACLIALSPSAHALERPSASAQPTATPAEPARPEAPPLTESRAPALAYTDPAPSAHPGITMGMRRYSRSGLILRPTLGLGVTHIFRRTETTVSSPSTGDISSASSSLTAAPLEFRGMIGGALRRDLLLGGYLGIAQSPGATFRGDGELGFEEGIALQMLGAQLLWFMAPDSPWQVGAAFAFLNWSAHEPGSDGKVPGGTGILGTAEAGYHLWIGQRFELGLLLDFELGVTQQGQVFRVSEVLVQNSEASFLIRGGLAISLSYY
ncbi:MAG TPA: hypothetical protein VLC09_16860 [Polyangiaceae bacterium]|nr:hypothetical protein [Polyangiaceae bacterium]